MCSLRHDLTQPNLARRYVHVIHISLLLMSTCRSVTFDFVAGCVLLYCLCRFLTTLERHFKNISQGSFGVTLDTLPSMMNAIRMVWVISRHYNTDERMVPLMELIAGEIAGKVRLTSDARREFPCTANAMWRWLFPHSRGLEIRMSQYDMNTLKDSLTAFVHTTLRKIERRCHPGV